MKMKYYGTKAKLQREKRTFAYAKAYTRLRSILPGFHREYFKQNYAWTFGHAFPRLQRYSNNIPEGHYVRLDQMVTSDLIRREDIKKLQRGLRALLKEHRAGDRFIVQPIANLEEICDAIDNMDSTLPSWYDGYNCGIFDFRNEFLESDIDHYTVRIQNVNSSYLSIEFQIHLTQSKAQELHAIINANHRGFCISARKMLACRNNGGAFDAYSLHYIPDDNVKADRVYEWVNCVEWELYDALKKYFPFVLHNIGLMPPRIEVYLTDLDYHDNNSAFWNSIGITSSGGQFIDDRQKLIFMPNLSARYERTYALQRLMYIVKDNELPVGKGMPVKEEMGFYLEYYSKDFFKFMFLDTLCRHTGKKIIKRKRKLDRIRLYRQLLRKVLKERYLFECDIDCYAKYARDDIWECSIDTMRKEMFAETDDLYKQESRHGYYTYQSFCEEALVERRKIDKTIDEMRREYDSKGQILQRRSDYVNMKKNWVLNCLMLIATLVTLFFVVFPHRAEWAAEGIRKVYNTIITIWQNLLSLYW